MTAFILILSALSSALAGCNAGDGSDTTTAPTTTAAAPGTTEKADTTAKPETTALPEASSNADTTDAPDATTAEPETDAPLAVDTIPDAEMTVLRLTMPQTLPDGSDFDILTRLMCCDNDEDYFISGNSAGSTSFVGEADGAVYGKAIRFAGKADSKESRGEITVQPATVRDVAGCNCVARDSGRIINAQSAYCRYNNYTECKTRERIHGIVAVKKALKYRSALVCRLRCNVSRFADGRDERRNDKQAECHKEQRGQYFAYPCENLARA